MHRSVCLRQLSYLFFQLMYSSRINAQRYKIEKDLYAYSEWRLYEAQACMPRLLNHRNRFLNFWPLICGPRGPPCASLVKYSRANHTMPWCNDRMRSCELFIFSATDVEVFTFERFTDARRTGWANKTASLCKVYFVFNLDMFYLFFIIWLRLLHSRGMLSVIFISKHVQSFWTLGVWIFTL